MDDVVTVFRFDPDLWPAEDWRRLDRSHIAWWVERLTEGERSIRKLRLRLVELDNAEQTTCRTCGGPVFGRADARYCSAACRQKAYRQRR
jgi:hypothetical protein